ncbi:hypothetical protein [Pontibacter sp. H249]|uniref:hypothetical protein n=1 Tax=Pontibacter sp. H249 TaxID=3133420 RepID=UPI0030C3B596
MKKLILSLSILFITSVSAFAQNGVYTLTPDQEAKCTELTRTMVNELRLNEIGYIKLKALNRERLALTTAVKEKAFADQSVLDQKLQEIETDFDNKLVAILNANQLQAYANYKRKAEVSYIAASEEK